MELIVMHTEIEAVPERPAENTLIDSTDDGKILFYRLDTGEYQLNVIQPDGKMYVLIFDIFQPGGGGYTSFEYEMR